MHYITPCYIVYEYTLYNYTKIKYKNHKSKLVDELKDIKFDYVITVCGHANENCPIFPGNTRVIHVGFDDPPKLAQSAKNEEEALNCYRQVRDGIRDFIKKLPGILEKLK